MTAATDCGFGPGEDAGAVLFVGFPDEVRCIFYFGIINTIAGERNVGSGALDLELEATCGENLLDAMGSLKSGRSNNYVDSPASG